MITLKKILLLILLLSGLSSCLMVNSARSTKVEIMKPGVFGIPKDIMVAVFNRDLFQSDTCIFKYFNGSKEIKDTTIKYHALSNVCIDALADYLKKEAYFQKVINYRDSLNSILKDTMSLENNAKIFETTRSDVCIFLDFLNFHPLFMPGLQTPFASRVDLLWTITSKYDSLSYGYNQIDTLYFDEAQISKYPEKKGIPIQLLNISSTYLGEFMGKKVVPTWFPVDRLYYRSQNRDMLMGEKLALNNEWLKAAEIWNRETKNKNPKIAAKACFNMALACEMEGKLDLGINWLVKSYTGLTKNDVEHKANCQRYINVLAMRKKEIEKLAEQIGN